MTRAYHFTDTARLPWILSAGVLRPTSGSKLDYPDPDFLWATRDPNGDVTAAGKAMGDASLAVRFTLDLADFVPWREARRSPRWREIDVFRLEFSADALGGDPRLWLCRDGDLPRGRWLAIDTKGEYESAWTPFDVNSKVYDFQGGKMVRIGTHYYGSRQCTVDGKLAYKYGRVPETILGQIGVQP